MRLTETDIVTILWEYNTVLEKKLLACYFNSIHCLCTFVLCHKWQNKRLRTIHDWFKSKHLCQHPVRPTLFSWLTRLREKKTKQNIFSLERSLTFIKLKFSMKNFLHSEFTVSLCTFQARDVTQDLHWWKVHWKWFRILQRLALTCCSLSLRTVEPQEQQNPAASVFLSSVPFCPFL